MLSGWLLLGSDEGRSDDHLGSVGARPLFRRVCSEADRRLSARSHLLLRPRVAIQPTFCTCSKQPSNLCISPSALPVGRGYAAAEKPCRGKYPERPSAVRLFPNSCRPLVMSRWPAVYRSGADAHLSENAARTASYPRPGTQASTRGSGAQTKLWRRERVIRAEWKPRPS